MHIPLADEQPRVRSAIRLLLEQQPEVNIVEGATYAQTLLDQVRNRCPDMLLLDWELPGLVPEKLLTQLRASCPGPVIIALDSRPQTRRAALEVGASEFVGKNEPPDRLLVAIKSHKNATAIGK